MKHEVCQAATYTAKCEYSPAHHAQNARRETGSFGIRCAGHKFHGIKEIMWRWNLKVDNLLRRDLSAQGEPVRAQIPGCKQRCDG